MRYLIAWIATDGEEEEVCAAIKTMSGESDTVARAKSAPADTANARPKLSLRNQEGLAASFQSSGPLVPPTRSTESIRTYYPWSIFNLLFVPFGLLCCYFSHKVSQLKNQNRHEVAKKMSHRTFVLNIMTTLLMVGVIVTTVMLRYDYDQNNMDPGVNATRTTAAYIPWQPGR